MFNVGLEVITQGSALSRCLFGIDKPGMYGNRTHLIWKNGGYLRHRLKEEQSGLWEGITDIGQRIPWNNTTKVMPLWRVNIDLGRKDLQEDI